MPKIIPLLLVSALLAGCATQPPQHPADVCAVFQEEEGWYAATRKAQRRWGVPIPVQMAIIYQESSYVEDARPPREYLLGFIPWLRPSSAYGYGQVLDGTWDGYQKATGQDGADRDEFEDVADFIGWYAQQSQARLGIAKQDAYRQYLAYHEGQGGYQRRSYAAKPWLLKVARKVAANAGRYQRQLAGCGAGLERAVLAGE